MTVVSALGVKGFAPKCNFFSLSVLSKTVENENFIKNCIILIIKSVLKEVRT